MPRAGRPFRSAGSRSQLLRVDSGGGVRVDRQIADSIVVISQIAIVNCKPAEHAPFGSSL